MASRVMKGRFISRFLILATFLTCLALLTVGGPYRSVSLSTKNTVGNLQNLNKPKPNPPIKLTDKQREQQRVEFWSAFPRIDYEAPEPADPSEREKRTNKS